MVISHNNDQFLEGDRNKDKIRLVFYHGTEADIIVTGGDSLCHRNGLFMKNIKADLRMLFVVQIQRIRKKIPQ